MIKNKRGQEFSLNTIVIAILVVVVFIVVEPQLKLQLL